MKGYGGKEGNTALEGLECACLLHARSAGLLSSDSAYALHMPQSNWYGNRHLADNPDFQAIFSSVQKQIQLFLPTSLRLRFQLLKCFFFECKFLGVVLYLACKWTQKVQIHKVILYVLCLLSWYFSSHWHNSMYVIQWLTLDWWGKQHVRIQLTFSLTS